MNKRGFLDFMSDLFFLIVISIFLLIFVGFALEFNQHNAQKESIKNTAEINELNNGLIELRNQLVHGKEMEITDLDSEIVKYRQNEPEMVIETYG
jgi:hypothetical protein